MPLRDQHLARHPELAAAAHRREGDARSVRGAVLCAHGQEVAQFGAHSLDDRLRAARADATHSAQYRDVKFVGSGLIFPLVAMGLLILITSLVKSAAMPPTSLPASVVTLAPLVGEGSQIFYTDDANSTDGSGLLLNESAESSMHRRILLTSFLQRITRHHTLMCPYLTASC